MQAGRLRHRVIIQSAVEARNAYGEAIKTWSTVATVYASVEPIRGREMFDAEQVQSEVTHRVRLRYRPGLTSQMRLLFNARTFEVQTVINVNERNREVQLMCKETPDA